jgi:CubicO group peptidase (beta-lactamase class C family)
MPCGSRSSLLSEQSKLNKLRRVVGPALAILAGSLIALTFVLWVRPPELIRIGANFTAKIVCSNVFLASRDPMEVLWSDVQAPGHPLLRLMRVEVDRKLHVVRAGLFGFIGGGLAVARPDVGCAVVADGRLDKARADSGPVPVPGEIDESGWPGNDVLENRAALQRLIDDDALAGPGMRAIVVLHNGRLVAERYAAGFDRKTPQLGWSMTKSVTAGIIGLLVQDGRLKLDQSAGWPAGGGRERITIADLLCMSSGLQFNEGYGAVSDVTRMLYLEPDMAAFARAKPLIHPVGEVWSYSSGTAVILSRIVQDTVGADAVTFIRTRLFDRLGMKTAVMETDETGTLVGSSYMYATPRDWARYGQLLAQDGVWQGQELLPRGYVAMMASPVAASGGEYGHGLVWRWATHGEPGRNSDAAFGIPADTFWMGGHDGQYVAVIPSRQLVLVRMGLTPARQHYQPQPLVRALLDAAQ